MKWLVAAVVCACGFGAEGGTFGRMAYVVPDGWGERRYANGVLLSPQNMPAGEHLDVTVMLPRPAGVDLSKDFEASWDDACAQLGASKTRTVNGTPYTIEAERTSFKGWPYSRGTGVVTAAADGRDYFAELVVMKVNDRLERILVVSRQNNHGVVRYTLYESPEYREAVRRFVFGVTFDDWKEPAVKRATLNGAGIVGVWRGISMFGGSLKAAYAIFFSNGQVFFGSRFPLGGCDGLDTWIDAETVPRYWGTYTFAGDAGVMKMPYGEVPVRTKGNDIVLTTNKTEHTYVRYPAVDGAKFNGTYVIDGPNNSVVGISFTPDGSFEDSGALDVLSHQSDHPLRITATPGGGTYAVKDYTITFSYRDGRRLRVAYSGVDHRQGDLSPATLVMSFNDDTLRRR